MKERFEAFINATFIKSADSVAELKSLYKIATDKDPKCESDSCITNMLNEVRKYASKQWTTAEPIPVRKYLLKEGNHTIAPGGPAEHNNDNTSDEDIDLLLPIYPHIKDLLVNGD